ncbi:MAG TPA: KpsF/GutQ family sugar-phosphate isomerase [Bacteroidetes bacterium]|nr:KpsF/GutQ family sugar-phosphate isomerase [Bacteroidota bacterium]
MKNRILDIGKKVITLEKNVLDKLITALNEDFVDSINCILNSSGRVVVTGVGKSAIIAQKIVATLNSTGTHSIYMHAGDAVHGDLGMIKNEDIVMCLSKSGETSEIKVLVSVLKRFGNKIIGMTSNHSSYLAKSSDYLLYIPVEKEAEPNNLAPTASSIAQMAMGDAIASTLLELRGFTSKQFAKFHPGGALGKQLYLKVSDIVVRNERPSVSENSDLEEIIIEMTSKRLGATAVLDEKNKISGIITDGDLRRMLNKINTINDVKAHQIMTKNPKTILSDSLAVIALEKMKKNSITQLIVTDKDNNYIGFIHIHDLVKEGIF